MEHALPISFKLYGEKLHEHIAFAFEGSKNGALERLCGPTLDLIKTVAPTIFEECYKLPARNGCIRVMTPCKKHMTIIDKSSSQMLCLMENYYRYHSCSICQKKETEDEFAMVSRHGEYNSELLDRICDYPDSEGANIDAWDDYVDIDSGWFCTTLDSTDNVKDVFKKLKWKEYCPGVFYRGFVGIYGECVTACVTITDFITVRPKENFIDIVAAHMEIVELLEKMKSINELLPQPIAEEINEFYH